MTDITQQSAAVGDDTYEERTFDESTATEVLVAACAMAGLDAANATLIRLGENAVFRLPAEGAVARIARSESYTPEVERQLAVARWLAAKSVAAVEPLDVDQPVIVGGRVAAFWKAVANDTEYGSTKALGGLLQRLHSLPVPDDLDLPPLDPFTRAHQRIETVSISDDERAFLRARCKALEEAYANLSFDSAPVVLHGDANVGNTLVDSAGVARLADLDSFCVGPPEWDLLLTALFYQRFGWHTAIEYSDFVAAYGRDILTWPGFRVLADLRELLMVSWLAQNVHDSASASELGRRIEIMRLDGDRRSWKPF